MGNGSSGQMLKIWMKMLTLAAVLLIFPVDVLWGITENGSVQNKPVGSEAVSQPQTGLEEEKPQIALTFDDGPNARYTPVLLDGLKERQVKATFFVIGANIEKDNNELLIQRMDEEGHQIGNHTYHHVDLSEMKVEDAIKELRQTDGLIEQITGQVPFLIRPPFGAFPKEEEPDKLYVRWTVDSEDWISRNTQAAVKKVVTDTEENDIILMHDCYETSVEAALQIVDILCEKGYEFVTVDELLLE